MAAVNWFWMLLLAFLVGGYLNCSQCIQVTPDAAINNATNSFAHSRNATAGAIASDSELSASERNRRLIPYMAFYLPPDFPINQQYAIQRHKQNQHNAQQQNYHNHLPPSTAIESAGVGPIPPPAHIPIPTAYVQHTKVPSSDAELEYPPHYQPPSAGEVYHTIAYGGSSGGGAGGGGAGGGGAGGGRHPTAIGNKIPILHLLPPGPPGAGPHSPYKEIRQKTVQHFPPTPPTTTVPPQYQHQHAAEAQHQHLQQQQQQQAYRLRPKQSKNSLTPFTPSNTLPGHFVPIIYTPVRSSAGSSSSSSSIDQHGNNNGNTINYNYDTDNPTITVEATVAADEEEIQLQQQQHQHQYKSSHKQPQQQHRHQTIVEYPLPPSSAAIAAHLQQQQQQPQLQHQVQFVTGAPPSESLATGPATATHPPTSSSIYHVINEASQSFSSAPSQHQQQQSLIAPQQVQQQHYRQNQNHPHFHPPTAENFFDSELRAKQQQQHHQQPQSPPSQLPQYVNADNITPQEKYVMFLQERIRYNKHQQKQRERAKEEHEHEQYHQHKQYQQQQHQSRHQQQQQIFVISTATPPVEHTELVQQQHHSLPETSPQNNYPQHSPIRHAVYSRPELSIPANHQPPNSKALQQVLHIPFRAIVGELDALQQQHQSSGGSSGNAHQKLLQPHYPKSIGPSTPPRYIDYILDEPKQSLDEEQQQHHHNVPHPQIEGKLKPALASPPPHAAYILITTAAPHPQQRPQQQQHQEHYVSTMRPIYKNQPTLQLQPITNNQNYATKPAISTTLPAIATATPKYVYFSAKPSYSQVLTPTPATKLKPSYKYRVESNDKASPLQAIASPSPSIKYASPTAATKPHQQVEIDERQRQHQQHHHHQYQPHLPPTHSVKSGPHYPSVSTSSRNGEGAHQQQTTSAGVVVDPNQLPDIRSSSLAEILHKLQASNHLPKTLTPDNIDNSIKTLVTILNNLKQTQTIVPNPPQHHDAPPAAADYDYTTGSEEDDRHDAAGAPAPAPAAPHTDLSALSPVTPNKHPGPSTGRPGIDYPNYAEIPQTSFDCAEQRYKGFFGDPETNCQVWHYCDLNGGKASFLCPNGTIFSQIALTCDWWFNVKCSTTAQLYVLNERLYKYILPFTPKFPEDYSGPLVDKYLAMKFQEMEEKMRLDKQQQKQKAIKAATESEVKQNHIEDDDDEEITTLETSSEHDHGHESDSHKHESVNSQVGEQSSERNLLIDDEVDDISQRGSIDTFESTTQATLNSTKEAATVSFSLNPIVVSSTVEPAEDNGGRQNTPKEHIEERNNKETAAAENYQPQKPNEFAVKQQDQQQMQQQHESTKISVEKVEVIEIKSDGTSGHLMPTMYFTTTNEEEKSR